MHSQGVGGTCSSPRLTHSTRKHLESVIKELASVVAPRDRWFVRKLRRSPVTVTAVLSVQLSWARSEMQRCEALSSHGQ